MRSLEKDVMDEIASLSVELNREEQRRADADKQLMAQVHNFLAGLQSADDIWSIEK